jgi:DNA replication protein DnaC
MEMKSISDEINALTGGLEKWGVVSTDTEARMCDKHGKYQVTVTHYKNGETTEMGVCPHCEREHADAETRRKNIECWTKSGIGRRYWDEDFDTFDARTPELKHHLAVCRRFVGKPAGALVLLGGHGNGKNHLVAAVVKRTGGRILTMFTIGLLVKRTYGGKSSEYDELLKISQTPGVLVIDEIGRSSGSDWELNVLSDIINTRYENMRPYILMSNLHVNADCPNGKYGCPDCFETFVGSDIISRLYQDGEILVFHGDDYRIKKRQ